MSSYQLALVESSIQRELAIYFSQHITPLFPEQVISIASVSISKDLRHAKVFLAIYKGNEIIDTKILKRVKSSSKNIGQHLNKRIKMRYVPKILWINDKLADQANNLMNILDNLD